MVSMEDSFEGRDKGNMRFQKGLRKHGKRDTGMVCPGCSKVFGG